MELVAGHVTLVFNTGDSGGRVLRDASPVVLNDDQWHEVTHVGHSRQHLVKAGHSWLHMTMPGRHLVTYGNINEYFQFSLHLSL